MGFTYAVQVPTGRERQTKVMIVDMLKRFENPGILSVQALETFTQRLSDNGLSARHWKAKVSGYIFVTIAKTAAGLGMDPSCWQFLKRIPLIKKILDQYLDHDEWKNFFERVTEIEPEVQLVQKVATKIELTEQPESSPKETSLATIIETVAEIVEEKLEEGKDQVVTAIETTVAAVRTVVKGCKTLYAIPYKLYKAFVKEVRQKEGDKSKSMSVQSALGQLKTLAKKAVSVCRT
jgi:hypothetical protein